MKFRSVLLPTIVTLFVYFFAQAAEVKTIDIHERTISYFDEGKGIPVILVHGLFANKEQWLGVSKKLSADYRVIIPDLPGFGKSSIKEKTDYVLEEQVKLLDLFLEALNAARFHFAGNSMGGSITALYTKKYPKKVISLTFVGAPGGVSTYTDELRKAIFADTNPFIPETKESFLYELDLLFNKPPVLPDEKIKSIVSGYKTNFRDYQFIFTTVTINMLEMQANQAMKDIKIPTLILWGENDRIFNVKGAHDLQMLITMSELKIFQNTGHLPMVEDPDRVYEELLSFISQIE